MDAVIYSITLSAMSFLGFLFLKRFDQRLLLGFGLLFALYIGLDDLLTGLPSNFAALRFVQANWNWSGKTYSLLLSVLVIIGFKMNRHAIGLVWPKRNIIMGLVVVFILTAIGMALGYYFEPARPSLETLAFQALMPVLAEEMAFRGIAPALMLGLIKNRKPHNGIPWAVIIITAIPFGLVHGLSYADGVYRFTYGFTLYTFTGALTYGWLRFRTGSLLFPVLAHAFANVGFFVWTLF